jgi:hypothetical protein
MSRIAIEFYKWKQFGGWDKEDLISFQRELVGDLRILSLENYELKQRVEKLEKALAFLKYVE